MSVKCSLCKYEWTPKVENPKQCPRCKRYDYQEKTSNVDVKKEVDVKLTSEN